MKVRRVSFAFVSAAFLAALATNGSPALATSSSVTLTRDAYQALQAGDADTAIASYTQAINSRQLEKEVLANALLNRALAYQQKSADEQAIADYTQALALDAMSPSLRATALYNRGLSRQKTKNLPAAVEDFTASLLLNPEFSHAYYGRATALRESGQLLFALSDYDRALSHNYPDQAKVHYGIALTYIALRRPIDARKALAAVLSEKPDHAGALAEMSKLNTSENAELQDADADPMQTGSVDKITTDGAAKAKAVDVPAQLLASAPEKPKKRKKYTDRVPTIETASTSGESAAEPNKQTAKAITLDEVPAVPPPVNADNADEVTTASTDPVSDDTNADASQPQAEPVAEAPSGAAAEQPVAEAAAPEADQPSGYMVQIASAASEEAAWSTWKKMQKRSKVLRDLKPIVVKADLGTKGVFYRVRLHGFEGQSDAASACSKLKAGGVQCFVSKT